MAKEFANELNRNNEPSGWDSLSENNELGQYGHESTQRKQLRILGKKILGTLGKDEVSPTQVSKDNQIRLRRDLTSQEKIERAFNDTFLSMDELEPMIKNGAEESSFRIVEYGGKRIPIYFTGNLPIRFLYHSIQYSGGDKTQPLMRDPSIWDKNEKQARELLGNKFSNMLSMEYVDSIEYRKEKYERFRGVGYGFLHLPAKSLSIITTAGQSLQKQRNDIYLREETRVLKELPGQIAQESFMELQAFRYDDDSGKPAFSPDFILAPAERGITEDVLRQAIHFNAPIFEIPTKEVRPQEKESNNQDAVAEKLINEYIAKYNAECWRKEKRLPGTEELSNMRRSLHWDFYEANKNDDTQTSWRYLYPKLWERKLVLECIQDTLQREKDTHKRWGQLPNEEDLSKLKQRLHYLMSTSDPSEWSLYAKRAYPELWELYRSQRSTDKQSLV